MTGKSIRTTAVGSYPITPSTKKMARPFFNIPDRFEDPFLEYIDMAVADQVQAGIDIVSDGQIRNDMVRTFTNRMAGTKNRDRPIVIDELAYTGPITSPDIARIKNRHSDIVIKGIITGPYTLAMSVGDEHYGSVEKLSFAFADILSLEIEELSKVTEHIQIDEPFFSVEYPEYAHELMRTLLKNTRDVNKALHVCGNTAEIFSYLIEMPVDILDHEFAANPGLQCIVLDHDFPQDIAAGCVRSDDIELESPEEIARTIRPFIETLGKERVLMDPDCGLRHLNRDAAKMKLSNINIARRMLEDEQ